MESTLRVARESSLRGPREHGAYSRHFMKNLFPLLSPGILTALAALLLPSASMFAQAPAATPAPAAATPAPKPLSVGEKNFIKNASGSIYYLSQLAAAAKTAVTDEKLARFRDTTSRDMKKAYDGLNTFAKAHGETITSELTGGDKTSVERLAKLKADRFAKQWLEDLQKEAKKLEKDFEAAARSVQDPDLKTYVANYSPLVRGTFAAAESAEKELKAPKKK